MYDNKIRLSQDVLDKAEQIASAWGLKNARAAVEAVFRCYSDDYLHGRSPNGPDSTRFTPLGGVPGGFGPLPQNVTMLDKARSPKPDCEALDALDELLAM
jgi:hypothetical protein